MTNVSGKQFVSTMPIISRMSLRLLGKVYLKFQLEYRLFKKIKSGKKTMYKSIFELTVKRLTIDAIALNADCPIFKT